MAKIYGQLEKAQLELLASDPGTSGTGMVYYNTATEQMRLKQSFGWISIGDGGGGSSLMWIEDADAPLSAVESNNRVYLFQAGLTQSLYALIRVPSSYTAGKPISLRLGFYTPDTSGTVLIQTVSTLIRSGVDAVTTTANQRTSTNAAATVPAQSQVPSAITLDLTDTAGKINSISVAPNDYIKVSLKRGTDTAVSDARVPVYGTEVTFK